MQYDGTKAELYESLTGHNNPKLRKTSIEVLEMGLNTPNQSLNQRFLSLNTP